MLSLLFVFLLAQPPATGAEVPAESPAVVAQRAAAEGLEAQSMYGDAGDAYVKLAEMPGVNRRSELDRAHTNYDSAYLATQNPSRLCWALKIAERVVREGEFNNEEQASYWRDTVDDDLRRLQADARSTQRANCRFDGCCWSACCTGWRFSAVGRDGQRWRSLRRWRRGMPGSRWGGRGRSWWSRHSANFTAGSPFTTAVDTLRGRRRCALALGYCAGSVGPPDMFAAARSSATARERRRRTCSPSRAARRPRG